MQYLKANDAATVLIGPFVAFDDGVTPVTDVTLAGADHAELMKHDGTSFVDMTSNGRTFTHKEGGWYTLLLGAGDIDTEGRLTVLVMDTDKCLPVWKDFMVLAEAAYDSMFTAKDTGYMDVDIKAVGGTATPHTSGKLHVLNGDGAAITAVGPTKTEMDNGHAAIIADTEAIQTQVDTTGVALLPGAVDDIWDELITGAVHNTATSAGKRLRTSGHDETIARDDTCQAGEDSTHVKLDSGASGTDGFYDHMWIYLTGNTGVGQVRIIDSYVGSTFVAEVHPAWQTNPDETTTFTIMARGEVFVHDIEAEGLAAIQAELEEDGASILDTLTDKLPGAQKG